MVDEETLSFIAKLVEPTPNQTILEIGPGLGFLTLALLERLDSAGPAGVQPHGPQVDSLRTMGRPRTPSPAESKKQKCQLIAIEKDRQFAGYLKKRFVDHPVQILEQDILSLDLKKDLRIDSSIKIVGNIPYNITSPILEWLIGQRQWVSNAVLTMQWEVAQRLTAKPGTKNWGSLSIFTQVYADIEIAKKVSKGSFFPSPKVDSAIVKLSLLKTPKYGISNEENFFKLIRLAFQKRRKTILNALVNPHLKPLHKPALESALTKAGIDAIRRPETLTIPEWASLTAFIFA